MNAIGVIDTIGFVGSIEALDVCLKTADVKFVNLEKMSGGIVSIVIKGGVGAVTASVSAGIEASKSIGGYLRHTVIARLDDQTEKLIYKSCGVKQIDNSESYFKHDKKSYIESIAEDYVAKTAITTIGNEEAVRDESMSDNTPKDSGNSDNAIIQEETVILDDKCNVKQENLYLTKIETSQQIIVDNNIKSTSKKESDKMEELSKMTVSKLRKLARKMKIDNMKINAARKSDLISNILIEMRKREE